MDWLLQAALQYRDLGFSVIPVRADKQPVGSWKQFQKSIMSEDELRWAFAMPGAFGLAIVCGEISGNLEVIDIDQKNSMDQNLFISFGQSVEAVLPGLMDSLVSACTRSQGYHLFYRCPIIGCSTALARRPVTPQEKMLFPGSQALVLIETRGTGGYVLAEPSPGYRFASGSPRSIPWILPEERKELLLAARCFNTYTPRHNTSYPKILSYAEKVASPMWDYDRRGDVIVLLQRHGWKVVYETPIKTYLRRPGKTRQKTSGDFHHQLRLFTVFTTSTVFTAQKGYRPYAVYAILECSGDFKLAAKRLLSDGYGIPYRDMRA